MFLYRQINVILNLSQRNFCGRQKLKQRLTNGQSSEKVTIEPCTPGWTGGLARVGGLDVREGKTASSETVFRETVLFIGGEQAYRSLRE